MNEALRRLLEKKGLDPKATDEQAWEFYMRMAQNGSPVDSSLADLLGRLNENLDVLTQSARRDEAARDSEGTIRELRENTIRKRKLEVDRERDRIIEIEMAAERFEASTGIDVGDLRADLISQGVPVQDAYKRLMDRLATAQPSDLQTGLRVSVGKDERDKTREAAVEGLQLRAAIAIDTIKDRENEYQHLSLYELARNRMLCFNQSTRGLTKMELFGRSLSTSDFANILADVANKGVLDGFAAEPESYEMWVDTSGRVNDFKTHIFARASEAPSFQEINPDGGEYQYAKMSDKKESVAVTDQGIIVPFTRAAMVNDDLGALADIREKLGVAAKRKYGDLVYLILTGNPAMGDSNTLWDATNHGNYLAAGYAPSVASLNLGAKAMATQTDLEGVQYLNIRPQYLLHPWSLKGTVDSVLHDTTPATVGANTTNPWAYLTPVPEARLDAASTTAWYLAAAKGKTVKLFTLDGVMTPKVETREGWVTDGIEFKGRITAAAKAVDWVGMYKDDGTGGS